MKKIFSALLLICLVFGICSCAQSSEESFSLDLKGLGGDSSVIDFDGYECVIMQNHMAESATSVLTYPTDTLMADMLLERINEISEDFNCKVTLKTDGTIRLDTVTPLMMSGDYVSEIIFTSGPTAFIKAGFYHRLDAVEEYLDYTDAARVGTIGLLEQSLYKGIPYAVTPAAWPGKQTVTSFSVFIVNENLVSRFALDDPRDLLENGEWTWDTFERILPEYTIDDGSIQTKAANITWSVLDFAMMNGADYVKENSDGTVSAALDSEEIRETFDWCSKIFTTYKDCITFNGHDQMLNQFFNDEVVLAQTAIDHVIRFFSYEVSNYGIVPMPCGPKGTYGKWVNAHSENVSFGITVNAKEPEAAAMVINRMLDPFEGYETEEARKEYMADYFYDKRDLDLLMNIYQNSRWNYVDFGLYDYFTTATSQTRSGKSGTEIIEKYAEAANSKVEEYVVPNYELMKQFKETNN